MPRQYEEKINGLQKAAILLIVLGPERSASIFKHLKEEEIEELTLEIANTRSITPQVKDEVVDEFYQVCLAQQYIAEGGIGYAKELLEQFDAASDRSLSARENTAKGASPETGKKKKKKSFVDRMKDALDG